MIKRAAKHIVFYVLLLAFWQAAFYLGTSLFQWWKPYAFPSPSGVWTSLVQMLRQSTLFPAVWTSLRRAFWGFFLASVLGTAIGLTLTKLRSLSALINPLILGAQSLPSVCWVPFAILWFGLSENAILYVIIMGSAFSVSISVESAVRGVNPIYIKAARTMGAKGGILYLRVILPASLPALITGLRQGWSFAWRALMSAEVMSATIGLGQALILGRDLADINRVTLVILLIVLIGILIERLVFFSLESWTLRRIGL